MQYIDFDPNNVRYLGLASRLGRTSGYRKKRLAEKTCWLHVATIPVETIAVR